MRKSYGAFKSVDDLLSINGLGKKRIEKTRKYLTVGKAAAGKEPSPASRRSRGSAQLICPSANFAVSTPTMRSVL
jgi:hypothetical protein